METQQQETQEAPQRSRRVTGGTMVINTSAVKQQTIDLAAQIRNGRFTRVSHDYLARMSALAIQYAITVATTGKADRLNTNDTDKIGLVSMTRMRRRVEGHLATKAVKGRVIQPKLNWSKLHRAVANELWRIISAQVQTHPGIGHTIK